MMSAKIIQCLKLPLTVVCVIVMSLGFGLTVFAETTYGTFTKDSYGYQIQTQPAYTPYRILGHDLSIVDPDDPDLRQPSPLQKPSDLFIDSRDEIYIADTGNNRIVHFAADGRWLRTYDVPDSPLRGPQGVFVDEQGQIYVADTGNQRVVRLSPEGELLQEYSRPVSRHVPESLKFDPVKVIVDKRGYLYIVTMGGYYGMVQLGPDGEFRRFYGANDAPFSFMDALKRTFYTRDMYDNETSKIPPPLSNGTIDQDGFIYTVTNGENIESGQVKKLNFQGENILAQYNKFGTAKQQYGEYNWYDTRFIDGAVMTPQLIDVAVDEDGNITVLDSYYTYLSQYDASGNLLFYWGGPSTAAASQRGLLKVPVAIDVNSRGDLYVLDNQENLVQVFRLSEFGALVHHANSLTQQGRYIESEAPWREVLRLNAEYLPAILGLARVAYKKQDFEQAAEMFKRAGNATGYSEAFWQMRLQWFQQHFAWFMNSALAALAVYLLLKRWLRARRKPKPRRDQQGRNWALWGQLRQSLVIIRHPLDGFSALRYEGKGSYLSATVLLGGSALALLLSRTLTSFSFNPVPAGSTQALPIIAPFVGIWLGWVVCNYLIASIYQGEGRFKDVFIGSAYALMPLLLIGLPLALLSNIMTHAESAIYDYLQFGMYIWLGLLMIWNVQALHNYTLGETLINIALSLVALIILVVLIFLIVGLTNELLVFFYEVYQEVLLR